IGENLQFAAAVRSPHLSRRDRMRRLEAKLVELGLGERRDAVVGAAIKKTLSGGGRKRLNIGLDMIGMSDVYLFDEPTSGLSSKDSEHVLEIIRSMAHNKIIIVTIHQPSSKLFQLFHKALLLDKGGQLVAARPYSPEFWRDKYEAFRLIQDAKQVSLRREQAPLLPSALVQKRKRGPIRWHDEWTQFRALMRRSFISKLRNRANIWITTCAAPVLALLIGSLLRYSESGKYDFASAFHIPTYLFLGLL